MSFVINPFPKLFTCEYKGRVMTIRSGLAEHAQLYVAGVWNVKNRGDIKVTEQKWLNKEYDRTFESPLRGIPLSEEHKRKISDSQKKRFAKEREDET